MQFLKLALLAAVASAAAIPSDANKETDTTDNGAYPPTYGCGVYARNFYATTTEFPPRTRIGFTLADTCSYVTTTCSYTASKTEFEYADGGTCGNSTYSFDFYRGGGRFNLQVTTDITSTYVAGIPNSDVQRYLQGGHWYSRYIGPRNFQISS